MTQEEKELLLKDLCARLPYGVIIKHKDEHGRSIGARLVGYNGDWFNYYIDDLCFHLKIYEFKPYLRPMSSMTDEEKHKLLKFGAITCLENGEVIDVSCVGFERHADVQNYLNTCHFDYRGLIEKGLALEAPEGMYNVNEE